MEGNEGQVMRTFWGRKFQPEEMSRERSQEGKVSECLEKCKEVGMKCMMQE